MSCAISKLRGRAASTWTNIPRIPMRSAGPHHYLECDTRAGGLERAEGQAELL